MRKFNVVFLFVCCCLKGMSQDKRSAQALDQVIDDAHNSPKRGELLKKQFDLHEADGELLFLTALISKQKGARDEGNRLNDLALTYLRKKPGDDFLGRALLEKADYLNIDDDR
jgi:hypothetical protein